MTIDTRHLSKLFSHASSDTQALIQVMLEQDEVDRQWAAQVGPALTQQDVARLLEVSVQAVSKNRQLLRITNRDGRIVYPVVQFDGRRPLPGLGQVLLALRGCLEPLTTASWLTLATPALGGRSPADALRDSDVAPVLALAHQVARAAA